MKNRSGLDQDAEHESHNIIVLSVHQVLIRIAWVFKTESVIIPAFMDQIAGAGWLRGCLPVLSRIGLSLPPLMLAVKLKNARDKKWTLMTSSLLMAVPFLLMAGIWIAIDEKRQPWLPYTFLLLYLFFFSATGINNLAFGTVQGKLIRADRRGRLLGISGVLGTIFSVTCLLLFLTDWLQRDDGGFGLIFGFTGMGFVFAGLAAGLVKESDRCQGSHEVGHHRSLSRRLAHFCNGHGFSPSGAGGYLFQPFDPAVSSLPDTRSPRRDDPSQRCRPDGVGRRAKRRGRSLQFDRRIPGRPIRQSLGAALPDVCWDHDTPCRVGASGPIDRLWIGLVLADISVAWRRPGYPADAD